jgi:hypothetical protein
MPLEHAALDQGRGCPTTDWYLTEGKWIDPLDTRNVEAKLTRRTAALVMRVDATHTTKVVFRDASIPLI